METTTETRPVAFTEEENLKLASQIASANLLFAQEALAQRVIEPSLTTKGLLDIAEHSYKVSGMQKKQEPAEQQGKFIFNIIMGGETVKIEKEIGGNTLENAPETVEMLSVGANTLVESLSFADAPEFIARG